MSYGKQLIAEINTPALNDDEKIAVLIQRVRQQDQRARQILEQAKVLKNSYEEALADAAELRAELLKYGVEVYNKEQN